MRAGKAPEGRKGRVLKGARVLLGMLLSIAFIVSCGPDTSKGPPPKSDIPSSSSSGTASRSEPPTQVTAPVAPPIGASPSVTQGTGTGLTGPGAVNTTHIKSLEFSPQRPVAGEPLKLKVVFDESVTSEVPLRYRWKVNNEIVQESESNALTHQTKRGDQIEAVVFVGNSREETRAKRATLTVDNAPPVIKKLREHLSPNGEYLAQLEASDPDGDDVTVKLQRGATGMALNDGGKTLRWNVPAGTAGSFPVEVVASDPAGASVVLSYELTIRQVQQSAGSAANATTVSSPPR